MAILCQQKKHYFQLQMLH